MWLGEPRDFLRLLTMFFTKISAKTTTSSTTQANRNRICPAQKIHLNQRHKARLIAFF
jgi:hypothetical protein